MPRIALFLAAAAVACLAPSAAWAQGPQLIVERYDAAFALFLDGGELNEQFDTIDFRATPGEGEAFLDLNPSGLVIWLHTTPGEPYTFINDALDLPKLFGGYSYSVLGKTQTPELVAFTAGPLGGVIDTSADDHANLFLANLMPSRSFTATADLYRAGNLVASLTASGVVPEPATAALAGTCALLAAIRRPRQRPLVEQS